MMPSFYYSHSACTILSPKVRNMCYVYDLGLLVNAKTLDQKHTGIELYSILEPHMRFLDLFSTQR